MEHTDQGTVLPLVLQPMHDQVLIRRRPPAERVVNGVTLLATEVMDAPNSGVVMARGPGRRVKMCECGAGIRQPMTVQVGDLVLYGRYAGNEVTIDADTFVLVHEEEVLAILSTIEQWDVVFAQELKDAVSAAFHDGRLPSFRNDGPDWAPYVPGSDSTTRTTTPDLTTAVDRDGFDEVVAAITSDVERIKSLHRAALMTATPEQLNRVTHAALGLTVLSYRESAGFDFSGPRPQQEMALVEPPPAGASPAQPEEFPDVESEEPGQS